MNIDQFDSQYQQPQQQGGGQAAAPLSIDDYDNLYNRQAGGSTLPSEFTLPAVQTQPQGQSIMQGLQPTSITDASNAAEKDKPGDLVFGLRQAGTFLGNAAKDAASGVLGIGNAVLHPITTAKNIPGALASTAGGVGNWFKQLVTDPNAALGTLGNTVYEHPLTSLLMASGIGDGVGAGLKVAGSLGDAGALAAAKTAAGLTGDEAATATLGGGTNALTNIGQQISNGSNMVNPANLALRGVTAAKDLAGSGVARTLGATTQTGAEGASAIQDIADGNQNVVQGMRNAPRTDQANGFKAAVNTIDNANANNGGGALFNMQDILHGTEPAGAGAGAVDGAAATPSVADTLANAGLKLNVMAPADQATVLADLSRGVLSPASLDVFEKYYPNAAQGMVPAVDTSGKVTTKFLSSQWKPDLPAQSKANILADTLGKNGLVGVQNGPMLMAPADQEKVMGVVNQLYKLGSTDQGFEANATNLNDVKRAAQALYQPDSPMSPISNSQKTVNVLSKVLADTAQAPLEAHPSYNAAMQGYQDYYKGRTLNPLTGPSVSASLGKGAGLGELLAALGVAHFVNPATAAGFAATSPRIVGEAANVYGKAARGFGAVTKPAKAVASSGAMSSLLQLLGNGQQ